LEILIGQGGGGGGLEIKKGRSSTITGRLRSLQRTDLSKFLRSAIPISGEQIVEDLGIIFINGIFIIIGYTNAYLS
jgi:Na+-driven multidrug efflux pump